MFYEIQQKKMLVEEREGERWSFSKDKLQKNIVSRKLQKNSMKHNTIMLQSYKEDFFLSYNVNIRMIIERFISMNITALNSSFVRSFMFNKHFSFSFNKQQQQQQHTSNTSIRSHHTKHRKKKL